MRTNQLISALCLAGSLGLAAHASAGIVSPPNQLAKFVPGGPVSSYQFGASVAISGNRAAAGEFLSGSLGNSSGAVSLYDTTDGSLVIRILADDGQAQDRLGFSTAMGGGYLIAGAPGDGDIAAGAGAAYLFDADSGDQLGKLTVADAGINNQFGLRVAVSENAALVGGSQRRLVLFGLPSENEIAELMPSSGQLAGFGTSLAMSDIYAVVGASGDNENGTSSGAVYLFDPATGTELRKLTAPDGGSLDQLGFSVAIDGNTIISGAPGFDDGESNVGAAYLFDAATGDFLFRLNPDNPSSNLAFGSTVAIAGTTAIVGAFSSDFNGFNSGLVYLFDITTGAQIARFVPEDNDATDQFGFSIAAADGRTIIGANGDDDLGLNSGAAYLFELPGGSPPCPGDANGSGAVDLVDLNIILGNFGQPVAPSAPGDIDNSGVIDLPDLNAVLGAFGNDCP